MRPFPKGMFPAQRRHPLKGRVLNAIYNGLRQRTPVAGTGVQIREMDGGFQLNAEAEISDTGGAFYTLYQAADQKTYLQGGCLTIAGICHVFIDYWVIDPVTGPRGADEAALVIQVSVRGYVVDGMLLPGLTMVGNPVIDSPGSGTPPAYPTRQQPIAPGVVELPLGVYTADGFTPMQAGHRRLAFCPAYGGGHYHQSIGS